MQIKLRGRGRVAASLAVSMALFGGAAAVTATPAVSAEPAGDCTEAYPVADLADGDAVTGLTVSDGTTPEAFSGEILGVLEDGIAPGLDMVMARLTSPEIDRVGIWQGMSGSPVYAEDGRLIGAVAYGLAWGPSTVAGITPFEEMDNYLPDAPPGVVKVDKASAQAIAADSDVTANQASAGFSKLKVPFGVSGMQSRNLDKMMDRKRYAERKFLPRHLYAMPAGASPSAAGPETIVAGGNLAAAASFGDITMGGVGTATSVCDGGVVAFGHPANFLGTTSMTLHPADAIYVQEDPVGPGFKVANLGAAAGTITDDHLSGISGIFGALPPLTGVTSTVSFADRSRTGSSSVSIPEANAAVTFYEHIANHDRVIDGIIAGSEELSYTITGTDADGSAFELSSSDVYASDYDITFASPWEVADLVWILSAFEGVTVEDVTTDAAVSEDSSTWRVQQIQQLRNGEWVKVTRRQKAIATAGKPLVLQAVLEGIAGATLNVPLSLDVPKKAADSRGYLTVEGGAWRWTNIYGANNVDDLEQAIAESVRNDQVVANLFIEGRRRGIQTEGVSDPTDKVVYGAKRAYVKIR